MTDQVLVIDDEKDAVDDITLALEMGGITCRGQTDPQKAIESFRADPTDIVIVDYLFPTATLVDGIEVISKLQSIKPFTQFILISGKIDADLDEKSLTEQLREIIKANRYFRKPYDLDELVDTVRAALQSIEDKSGDWRSIAEAYVETNKVTPEEVRALNERIKAHLATAADDAAEEL